RHRSMADLATALERIAARRPARWIAAAAAMAAAAGLTFALGRGSAADASADAAACQAGQAQLAGAWDAARRDELVAALTATGRPCAAAAARAAGPALGRSAGGWVAAYTDACEATRARGEQSAALLDRRMACLARRRGELDALVTLLAS